MSRSKQTSMFTPLDVDRQEIRLARIKPSRTPEAEIECDLTTTGLQAHPQPQFEALSHFWGDTNSTFQIRLNGFEWHVPLMLGQALCRLRLEDRERLVWIDNLCINQADLVERASQIGLMHSIYRGARKVVVWLGDCKLEDQNDALLTLEYLSNGFRWMELFPNHEDEYGASNDTSKCVEGLSMVDEVFLEPPVGHLLDLLQSDWWERLWTLQEVVVARNIQFQWGAGTFHWSLLESAELNLRTEADSNMAEIAYLYDDFEYMLNVLTGRVREIQLFKAQQERVWHRQAEEEWLFLVFASALAQCRYRSSLDRRDKVFGLLGLFPENVRLAVNPSYQDSVREVHLRTAFLILQKTKCFFTLNHTDFHNAHKSGYPSWVPSWNSDERYYEDDEFRIAQRRAFSTSGSSRFSISMDGDGALCVSVVRVDKISTVFREIASEDPAGFRNEFLNWNSGIRQWNRENHNILGPESIIRRSMLVPILLYNCAPATAPSGFSRIDSLDLLDVERWLDLYPEMPENNEKLLRMTFTNCPSASIFKHMSSAVVGKALFITEMGYVGVMSGLWPAYFSKDVPWELFVLAGGTHPVILSSISGKPSKYEVISEAFVPRIMQGEIVDGKQPIANQHWRRHSRDRERFRPPWEEINLV